MYCWKWRSSIFNKRIENYIDGNIVSYSTKTQKVYDPSIGDQTAEVVLSNNEDFTKALKTLSKTSLNETKVLCKTLFFKDCTFPLRDDLSGPRATQDDPRNSWGGQTQEQEATLEYNECVSP